MSEEQDDKILHFIAVEKPVDIFSLVNDYVEHICEIKHESNFKDKLEEVIYLLVDELHEIVHEEMIMDTLQRCADMLSKKEYYE